MNKPRLLIVGEVDDLQRHFEEKGYEVDVAGTLAEAREKLAGKLHDLALCDWTLPDGESLPLFAGIHGGFLRTEIVMTGKPPAETAPLEAVKLGIYGHLERPFHLEDLDRVVEDTLEGGLARQQDLFADALLPQAVSVLHELRASRTILLRGERGTGKARVARMIHDFSERERPFLAFDCAGLSEPELHSALFGHVQGAAPIAGKGKKGLFQRADKGTLYLAGVDKAPLAVQAEVLRAVAERSVRRLGADREESVDVRLVVGTEVADLRERVRAGSFYGDLYRVLRVVSLDLPPLRKRTDSLLDFLRYFLWKHRRVASLAVRWVSDAALKMLEDHEWRGNLPELEGAVQGALARAKEKCLRPLDFPVFGDARPREGFKPSKLSDSLLLWHLLGLEDLPLAPCEAFCPPFQTRWLWAESEEPGEDVQVFTEPGWRKVLAVRRLATVLSLHQLDPEDLLDAPRALARYLFLEHAEPETRVTGALVLCQDGGWRVEIVHRGLPSLTRPTVRSVLEPALREGSSLLLFHLAPGKPWLPEERELAELVAQASRLVGIHFLGSWWISAPGRAEPLNPQEDAVVRPPWPLQAPVFQSRSRAAEGFEADLAEILGGSVSEVLSAHGAAKLAAVSPDELSCPSLSPAPARALASALELARRLGSTTLVARHALDLPEHLARELALCASSGPCGQRAVLLLDERGQTSNLHWLDDVAEESLCRRIVELAVADGCRSVAPVLLRPESLCGNDLPGRHGFPSMAEIGQFLDLRVLSPLVLDESGDWFFSDHRGRLGRRAQAGMSELFGELTDDRPDPSDSARSGCPASISGTMDPLLTSGRQ